MTIQLSKRLINVEEYHLMIKAGILTEQDHVELVQGEIIKMTPVGSKHAACVKRINALFNQLFGNQFIIGVQDPVKMADFSEPEPDKTILKPAKNFYSSAHPEAQDVMLIIAVADTSIDYDREIKLPIYAAAGVPEYWIVDLENDQIEAYHRPSGDIYRFKELARKDDELSARTFALTASVKSILG